MANYPDFIESTGYGDIQGLCGINCRHSFGAFFEGQEPIYTAEELKKLTEDTYEWVDPFSGETHKLNPYEASQQQRLLERNVRKWKKRLTPYEAAINAGDDSIDTALSAKQAKGKVQAWQKRLRAFTEQTGLKRQYWREKIS